MTCYCGSKATHFIGYIDRGTNLLFYVYECQDCQKKFIVFRGAKMLELDERIKYTRVTEEQVAGLDLGGEGSEVEAREYLIRAILESKEVRF